MTDVLMHKVANDEERAKARAADAQARLHLEERRLAFERERDEKQHELEREREENKLRLEREREQNNARLEFIKVVGNSPGLVTDEVQAMVGAWAKDLFNARNTTSS